MNAQRKEWEIMRGCDCPSCERQRKRNRVLRGTKYKNKEGKSVSDANSNKIIEFPGVRSLCR